MSTVRALEHVVITCGILVLDYRTEKMETNTKDEQLGQHFSTKADCESLEAGTLIIKDFVPNEVIIAEEQKNTGNVPLDCTVFDPLDGTTNYFNGRDQFSVTACTLRGGVPMYGATYFPATKVLVSAVRGKGCYIGGFERGRKINRIHWHGELDKTQIGTDIGSWTHTHGTFDLVLTPLARRFNILSSMAATDGGLEVLLGQIGAYYNLGIAKIWDAAAMALAIEEAGGIVCAPDGSPIRWNSIECDWIFAGNRQLAGLVLEFTRHWPGRQAKEVR